MPQGKRVRIALPSGRSWNTMSTGDTLLPGTISSKMRCFKKKEGTGETLLPGTIPSKMRCLDQQKKADKGHASPRDNPQQDAMIQKKKGSCETTTCKTPKKRQPLPHTFAALTWLVWMAVRDRTLNLSHAHPTFLLSVPIPCLR